MKKNHAKLNLTLILTLKRLKETEKVLKYELAKNKAIIENSGNCIKILDKKGNIIYMNKGGLKEHNFRTHKQAIGWDWVNSLEKHYQKKALDGLAKALKGTTSEFDVKHVKWGSNREWCYMTITPIKDEKSNVIQVLAISVDITKRKRIEKKLMEKIKKLEKIKCQKQKKNN